MPVVRSQAFMGGSWPIQHALPRRRWRCVRSARCRGVALGRSKTKEGGREGEPIRFRGAGGKGKHRRRDRGRQVWNAFMLIYAALEPWLYKLEVEEGELARGGGGSGDCRYSKLKS
ncbi:hypothetical protein WDZ92_53235 [Nostoc sp. NIES-2111]